MNKDEYLKVYIALRTAAPRVAAPAIATLRLAMIADFGEKEQRALVQQGNEVVITPRLRIPLPVHRAYCKDLFQRAGMTGEQMNTVSHLLQHFAPELCGEKWPDAAALEATCLARLEAEDWHNARLASNHLLALALAQADVHLAERAVGLTLNALKRWPEARADRPYEFTENEWIRGHLDELVGRFRLASQEYKRDMEGPV